MGEHETGHAALLARYEAEARAARSARDAEYWRFTRCARSSPVRLSELAGRLSVAEARVRALRASRRSPVRLLLEVVRAAAAARSGGVL